MHVILVITLTILLHLTTAALLWAQVEALSPAQIAAARQRVPDADDAMSDRQIVAAARVADDLEARNANADFLVHYVVPAISPVMRLADAYPLDGAFAGTVGIVAARDEYEPASFVLYAFDDHQDVALTVSDLKNEAGQTFPKANLDLTAVKVWYQNGNGWFSYFSDVGLALVPELLLHDENLIRVDTQRRANYARVGKDEEVWISPPQDLHVDFDAYSLDFADAESLQPVDLPRRSFKQFFLTAHVPADAKPGIYRGDITVKAGSRSATIPVALRVLPFELPLPKTNFDLEKDFLVSLMGAWPRVGPDHPAFMPTLKNLRRHNILHLGPNATPDMPADESQRLVSAMKEAGFETDFIFGGNLPWVGKHDGTPLTFDELMRIENSAAAWEAFYREHFGHTNAAVGLGDEQGSAWVVKTRPAWRIANQHGLKTNLAGHHHIFVKAGHMLDIHPTAGSPANTHEADRWRAVGHGNVGFYANQHNGSENPAFVRRQHGMLGYLSNMSMIDNYEFAYGPWNDRAYPLYKPMVLAYPTATGLVDTLAWEGFREGVDDMRYATHLRQLANQAIASGDLDRVYAGRKVRQWFALVDANTADLNALRLEMIEQILTLMEAAESN